MKSFLILILSFILLAGCSDNSSDINSEEINNETNLDDCVFGEIVGKWKLIKSEYFLWDENGGSTRHITYYNQENIIYDFQSNGVLIINGGNYSGPTGEYTYILEQDDEYSEMWYIKINTGKYTYSCFDGLMVLGQSYVDGADYFFERQLQ